MPTATFRFGDLNKHEMKIVAGYLGRERYYVDGQLVLDHWSNNPNAAREFIVGKHRVRIVVTFAQFSFSSRAYVDGRLHVAELFPAYAAFISKWFGWTHAVPRMPGAGNTIAHLSLYKTYDDVVAIFLDNGVLAYGSNKRWTFYPDGSTRCDSLNQEVHRNYYADKLTQVEFAQLGIPLPDVAKYRDVATMRWEDNFALSAAANKVPAAVRSRLESGPRSAWLVLLEDRYETMFGDGEYLWPRAAFWDKSAAEKYIEDTGRMETDAAKRQWYAYTLRETSLSMDRKRSAIMLGQGPAPSEHFDIADVVRLLEG